MIRFIYTLIIVGFLFIACSEKGILEYSQDITYLYFTSDASIDSVSTSFIFYRDNIIKIPLSMSISGKYLEEDMEYMLYVDLDSTNLPPECYELDDKYIFKKGQVNDTAYITFINQEILKTDVFRLILKIEPDKHYAEGLKANMMAKIYITDQITCPEWWSVIDYNGRNIATTFYLGPYSDKKYLLLLEVLDGVELDGFDRNQLRTYSLKLKNYVKDWNEENYPEVLWDEDNNQAMTIPVAG